tara:strand:+ start:109 stop:624 length:516 start_codon:yes stop_codon:yes gene_type:complete
MMAWYDMANATEAQMTAQKMWNKGGPQNGGEVAILKKALLPLVSDKDACLLAGAAGGAVIGSTQSWTDARQSVEKACGTDSFFGGRSYEDALAALKAKAPEAARIVNNMAKGKTATSTAQLNKHAKQDAKKVYKKAATVAATVTATAATGYVTWIIGGLVFAVIAAKILNK